MAIDFTMSKVNKEAGSDERHGFASATGNYGASSATGYKGASSVSDPTGVAVAWGMRQELRAVRELILSSLIGNM